MCVCVSDHEVSVYVSVRRGLGLWYICSAQFRNLCNLEIV